MLFCGLASTINALIVVCASEELEEEAWWRYSLPALILAIETGSNVSLKSAATIVCFSFPSHPFRGICLVEFMIAPEPFAPAQVALSSNPWPSLLGNLLYFTGWLGVNSRCHCVWKLPITFQQPVGVCGVMSSVNFTQKTGRYYLLTLGLYAMFSLSVGAPIMSTLRVRGRVALLEIGLVADSLTSSVGVNCALIVLSIFSRSIPPFKTSRWQIISF